VKISPEKLHNSRNFGKRQSRSWDDLRRPQRDAPAVLQLPQKLRPLASQEPVTDASRTFTIFHGRVRTIPVHACFNRAHYFKFIPDEGWISYCPESGISHSVGQGRDEPKEMFR